jgi:hypothetical protein
VVFEKIGVACGWTGFAALVGDFINKRKAE